jgi:integrase
MKKRNGEGSIYQLPNGKYRAALSLGNGKRQTFTGDKFADVQTRLIEAMRNRDLGLRSVDGRQTIKAFLTMWLSDIAKPTVRPATYRSYEQIVRNHLIPGLGKIVLTKLTAQTVSAFLKDKHDEGISAEHLRRVLRAALNQAIKWDIVQRNVASLATCPKRQKREIRYLDPKQAATFLQAVRGHRHEALYTVAVAVGLRLGEALGLKWDDIDFVAESLTVRFQLQRVSGKPQLVAPKTARGRRTVPLPRFAIEALRDHRLRQELQDKLLAGDRWQDNGFVFASTIGTPNEERNIRRSLTQILQANSLPDLRFHDLRHSCATLLLSQGVDPRTIMETLGHSQITLTLNTYGHVVPALQRDAADRMQSLFDRAV